MKATHLSRFAIIGLLFTGAVVGLAPSVSAADGQRDGHDYERELEGGWSDLQPAANSRIYYVSSSEGNDTNDGRSEARPFKTLERAHEALRDGEPDWMLLKRGDVWTNEPFPMWKKSGRGPSAPMVIGAYGEGDRPRLLTGDQSAFRAKGGMSIRHLAIVGLELYAHTRDGDESAAGIEWHSRGGDLLIEDCYVHHYKDNVVIMDLERRGNRRVRVRRCIINDAFSTDSHSQGLYAQYVDDLVVEECVFDHNGWHASVPEAEPTIFNHNIYIQNDNTNVSIRKNIIARGSSHGVQLRCGGEVVGNIFIRNPIALLVGGGTVPNEGGVTGDVRRNVILYGNDIAPDLPRGQGISVTNIRSLTIRRNILAFDASEEPCGHAIYFNAIEEDTIGVHNVACVNNLIYDWRGGIKMRGEGSERLRNIRIERNSIQDHLGDSALINHADGIESNEFRYADNTYHSSQSATRWFRIENVSYAFSHWSAHASDHTSNVADPPLIDPARSVAAFNRELGGAADETAFLETLRTLRRGDWTIGYTADSLRQWFETGLASAQAIDP